MIMNVELEMNEEEVRIWGKMVSKTEGVIIYFSVL